MFLARRCLVWVGVQQAPDMERFGRLLFSGRSRTGIRRSDALITRGRLAPRLGFDEEIEAAGELLWVMIDVIHRYSLKEDSRPSPPPAGNPQLAVDGGSGPGVRPPSANRRMRAIPASPRPVRVHPLQTARSHVFRIHPSVPNPRLAAADKVDTGPDLLRLRRAVQEGYVNRIPFIDDEPLRAGLRRTRAERGDRAS
jgi:hypothetical protein